MSEFVHSKADHPGEPSDGELLGLARAEIAELDVLRDKLTDLLSRTAIALRGPEPPLTRWSWHDLPERAEAAIAAIALVQVAERQRCAQIASNGCLVPPDGGSPTEDEAALCEEIARRIQETGDLRGNAGPLPERGWDR